MITRSLSRLRPHNDPLLVELGITTCDVAKVLTDTCSSVDLIFRDTLNRMRINLRDMKPTFRSLTCFNGASETMIGTIKLPLYVCGVTHTAYFSVICTIATYKMNPLATFDEGDIVYLPPVCKILGTGRSNTSPPRRLAGRTRPVDRHSEDASVYSPHQCNLKTDPSSKGRDLGDVA